MFKTTKSEFVRESQNDGNDMWVFSWIPQSAEICLMGLVQKNQMADGSKFFGLVLYQAALLDVVLSQCVDEYFNTPGEVEV